MGQDISSDEILGKENRVRVTPRSVPFGYQVEQWERHTEVFARAIKLNPDVKIDHDAFMCGWNAAFNEIYKPVNRRS